MAQVLRIHNWAKLYENNRTRELKVMGWVPIPNKLDGDGYTLIMSLEDGPSIYGTWIACVNLASRCDPRGTLLRSNGEPHTIGSIARITRINEKCVERMIQITSQELNWLILDEIEQGAGIPQEGATISHDPALKGREGNGIEEKGKKRKEKSSKVFANDSPEMVLAMWFWAEISARNSEKKKPSNMQSWAKDIDGMLRIDHRTVDEVKRKAFLAFVDEFWSRNILSPGKLRLRWNEGKLNGLQPPPRRGLAA